MPSSSPAFPLSQSDGGRESFAKSTRCCKVSLPRLQGRERGWGPHHHSTILDAQRVTDVLHIARANFTLARARTRGEAVRPAA
jgi:hypothetical protein